MHTYDETNKIDKLIKKLIFSPVLVYLFFIKNKKITIHNKYNKQFL